MILQYHAQFEVSSYSSLAFAYESEPVEIASGSKSLWALKDMVVFSSPQNQNKFPLPNKIPLYETTCRILMCKEFRVKNIYAS